jgi:hypothetical protein
LEAEISEVTTVGTEISDGTAGGWTKDEPEGMDIGSLPVKN